MTASTASCTHDALAGQADTLSPVATRASLSVSAARFRAAMVNAVLRNAQSMSVGAVTVVGVTAPHAVETQRRRSTGMVVVALEPPVTDVDVTVET